MSPDSEIGRVVAVDTAQISVELNREVKGMVRNAYEGTQEVGRINSYVILPVGTQRLVALVTRVTLIDEREFKTDQNTVTLPLTRRLMKATLIGTIKGVSFQQGVSAFPVLDNPVHLAERSDLDAIFGLAEDPMSASSHYEKPRFCIPIGESVIVSDRSVRIDPDSFFGKHAAILGGTGSGKSCTIATLLQSIHEQDDVKRTTCIILDTNGEYSAAFQPQYGDQDREESRRSRAMYIPSGCDGNSEHLAIPYWFMDSDDFLRIFKASEGVQSPVLLEALRLARNNASDVSALLALQQDLIREINLLNLLSEKDEKTSKDILSIAEGLCRYIDCSDFLETWKEVESVFSLQKSEVKSALSVVIQEAKRNIDGRFPKIMPADSREKIRRHLHTIEEKLLDRNSHAGTDIDGLSADIPSYFEKLKFRSSFIEKVFRQQGLGGAKAREHCGTMLLRIDRLLADKRFNFLFGPVGRNLPSPSNVLAAFIRDILGIGASNKTELSGEESVPKSCFPFYDRQRSKRAPADVVILDMSLLAAEVLENVTALIGRLILEFLQRLGEYGGEDLRGSLPVVLVLEEAQNYIRQPSSAGDDSIARDVFERIAREGRKYGLGLVVASQRPSELSKTVLSQCNSFIVHRLQNPEDLRYFKEIVPGIYNAMLEQLPALAPQTALILGECVPAPVLVKIREACPPPRSRNPEFHRYWVEECPTLIDVEAICREWEGGDPKDS